MVCLPYSDQKCPAETSGGAVRLCAVVIDEHLAIAAITEQGSTEFPDIRRCLNPTRGLRIEVSEFDAELIVAGAVPAVMRTHLLVAQRLELQQRCWVRLTCSSRFCDGENFPMNR